MRPSPLFVLVTLALVGAPVARAQAIPADTIVTADAGSIPVLALDPVTGVPHVAYMNGDTLIHAWRTGSGWLAEPVAAGAIAGSAGSFDLRITPDGRPVALYNISGMLECALRESGVWTPEPLEATPPYPVSLAVSPTTGEPVAAWVHSSPRGTPAEIRLARRASGVWNTQVVDTLSLQYPDQSVVLAVDHADRPCVAWSGPRFDAVLALVLTLASASGATGPFVSESVDSTLWFKSPLSLALDPASGEPRVAYAVAPWGSAVYADRRPDGAWERTLTLGGGPGTSLDIDPAGDPFIASTTYTSIGPADSRAPAEAGAQGGCVYFETGSVGLFHRAGGEGTGAFQLLGYAPDHDCANGPRGLASTRVGVADLVWRSPSTLNAGCLPHVLSHGSGTPLAGIGPNPGARVTLGPLAPNPVRPGRPLQVTFELERAGDVALELQDVAGRRLANLGVGRVGPGRRTIEWVPANLPAGVHWLSVSADGRRIGSRSLIVLR